jgi:23S rRNA (adenine2503-C2)-methyltransferase
MFKNVLPTGYLFVDQYEKGNLETLSIGDYGKDRNIKARFLGYYNDIKGVDNVPCKPLSEKWVITLSTQYGCTMSCKFCDVSKIKFKGNVSFDDLKQQLYNAIRLFPEISYTDRLNIHFARMGEPSYNKDVIMFTEWLYRNKLALKSDLGLSIEVIHPVFTTCCPKNNNNLYTMLSNWSWIKNDLYNGQAGLQISINSTDDVQRAEMFNNKTLSIEEIANLCDSALAPPVGRKYCLNFALADDYIVDAEYLLSLFDPDYWMVKITPIHNNTACNINGIKTTNGYNSFTPYKEIEQQLVNVGYDVIVFVPSLDEEDGLVTCGNLVLSGNSVKTRKLDKPIINGLNYEN